MGVKMDGTLYMTWALISFKQLVTLASEEVGCALSAT